MKRLVCEVLAYTLVPEQIHDLRKEFEKIDTENVGEFTIEQFRDALGKSQHVSAEECDQIFLDMDIEHSGKIHWHEFIAATLSKCEYDDRNLKLAFDRLDFDHQGFISKPNLMDIIGMDASEAEVEAMFSEVTDGTRITYEDFVKIMKNNGPPPPPRKDSMAQPSPGRRLSVSNPVLKVDAEGKLEMSGGDSNKDKHQVRNEIHMKIHAAAEERRIQDEAK
jgi:Ca2+-binding EF-hand superfamily protein